ncbi:hypothetical protein Tco_0591116 [Tanacetum coccineum]
MLVWSCHGKDKGKQTKSKEQDTSSRSGNDAHADDADIRPIYDEELMCCHALRRFPVFILINGEPWLAQIGGGIPFQLKSESLPHAHAQTTKTYYKHQDSRIKKAQDLKTKTSANSDIQDLPSRYQDYQDNDYQWRLLANFQDDAKYEHVG